MVKWHFIVYSFKYLLILQNALSMGEIKKNTIHLIMIFLLAMLATTAYNKAAGNKLLPIQASLNNTIKNDEPYKRYKYKVI